MWTTYSIAPANPRAFIFICHISDLDQT